jgi:hypothetical protein
MTTLVEQAEQTLTLVRPPTGAPTATAPAPGRIATLDNAAPVPRPGAGDVQTIQDTGGRGAGSRSGYAVDKYPHLVDGDEARGKAVPIAVDTGGQIGRTPPAQRRGGTHFEAVTASEAMLRAQQRSAGTLAPIQHATETQYEDARMESTDAPDYVHAPTQPAHPASANGLMDAISSLVLKAGAAPTLQPDTIQDPTQVDAYLKQRQRVSFELENGTYSIPAVDVCAGALGVIILLPCNAQDATFTPNPGTKVRVGWGDKTWDCYFPGTSFMLEQLGVLVITMIRNDEG